ncbi:aryl-alcohol oxidase-like protein [Mycena olivaceomarginata]|nr:aryl-alcohol oxidase-like protein [Mycena olivaceomarginata]
MPRRQTSSSLGLISRQPFAVIGGAAGNVVANRLTENPKFSVLVLEAAMRASWNRLFPSLRVTCSVGPTHMIGIILRPQIGLNNRTTPYPRARILGGCTAHNGMVYTRGSAEDYDRYAAVTGDPGWSWDSLLPYFFKNEKWTQPADHHDTRGQFNPSVHSTDGINSLPEEFPFNLDFNSGQMLGIGWLQSTIGGGKRSTSATSYLAPKFAQRKNLHVLLHAQVSRLVYRIVESSESLFTAKATKEIILGGVSWDPDHPHAQRHWRPQGVNGAGHSFVLDLPSPVIGAGWSVNSTQTVDSIRQNTTRFNEAYEEWNRTHTGPFVNLGATFAPTHIGWMRLDADSPIFENVTDPAAGPNTPHIEMFLGVRPTLHRGSVTLQSNNPFDPPLIDLGLLKTDFDIFTAREAIKRAYRFVQAPVWRDYIIAPTTDLSNLTTEALDQFIRNGASPAAHLVSTAAMSARDASYGVVNPDLLVKGASGLSIIDASILPFITSAHTQAAAYVVGERGADLVKERWA